MGILKVMRCIPVDTARFSPQPFLFMFLQNELCAVLGGDEESHGSIQSVLRCIHAARDLLHSRQDVLPGVMRIVAKLLSELMCAIVLYQVRITTDHLHKTGHIIPYHLPHHTCNVMYN